MVKIAIAAFFELFMDSIFKNEKIYPKMIKSTPLRPKFGNERNKLRYGKKDMAES